MSGTTDPRPTWYTKKLDNAVGYIPSGVSGNLYVYKTKRDMKMFKFNSAKTSINYSKCFTTMILRSFKAKVEKTASEISRLDYDEFLSSYVFGRS